VGRPAAGGAGACNFDYTTRAGKAACRTDLVQHAGSCIINGFSNVVTLIAQHEDADRAVTAMVMPTGHKGVQAFDTVYST
jgi:hypothetical protein